MGHCISLLDGGGGFTISHPCGRVGYLCNHPLFSRSLKASNPMEPEHDNTGYVFLFASPPFKADVTY